MLARLTDTLYCESTFREEIASGISLMIGGLEKGTGMAAGGSEDRSGESLEFKLLEEVDKSGLIEIFGTSDSFDHLERMDDTA